MSEKKVECPECKKIFNLELPDIAPATKEDIENMLKNIRPEQPAADHKHKTGDEFLDCPECSDWFRGSTKQYKISKLPHPVEVEMEMKETRGFGSFKGKRS